MQEYGFSAKFSDFFGTPPIPYSDCFPKLSSFKRTYTRNTGAGDTGSGLTAQGVRIFTCHFLTAEEPNFAGIRELQERKGIGNKYCKSLRTNGIRVKKKSSGSED